MYTQVLALTYRGWYAIKRHYPTNNSVTVVNVLDCDIVVSRFKFNLHYYLYFRANTLKKVITPFIFPEMGLEVLLLSVYSVI